MELKIFNSLQAFNEGLAEKIIEFDRRNMQPIFEKAVIEFPEEKRRKGLENNPTFIIAFERNEIAGYIEYARSWNDPNYIYISSVQIDERYRNTHLILRLLDSFRSSVRGEDFVGFETNVQKDNTRAAELYQKIGFKLEENPNNPASWTAKTGKDILENSPIIPLIESCLKK